MNSLKSANLSLEELLEKRTSWKRTTGGFSVYIVDTGSSDFVKNEVLEAKDPRLLKTANHWFDIRKKFGEDDAELMGVVLSRSLHLWNYPVRLNAFKRHDYAIGNIYQATVVSDTLVALAVECFVLEFAGDLPYVQNAVDDVITLESSKLDTQFGDWRERLVIAQSLDLDWTVFGKYVFFNELATPNNTIAPPENMV